MHPAHNQHVSGCLRIHGLAHEGAATAWQEHDAARVGHGAVVAAIVLTQPQRRAPPQAIEPRAKLRHAHLAGQPVRQRARRAAPSRRAIHAHRTSHTGRAGRAGRIGPHTPLNGFP